MEVEKFVEREGAAGRGPCFLEGVGFHRAVRPVDHLQGLLQVHEPLPFRYLRGKEAGQEPAEPFQGLGHPAAQVGLGYIAGLTVYGSYLRLPFCPGIEDFEFRVGHAEPGAPFGRHFPVDGEVLPDLQHIGNISGGVEPDQLQAAGVIGQSARENAAAAANPADPEARQAAYEGAALAGRGRGYGGHVAAVLVTQRQVVQQVLYRGEAAAGKLGRPYRADAFEDVQTEPKGFVTISGFGGGDVIGMGHNGGLPLGRGAGPWQGRV